MSRALTILACVVAFAVWGSSASARVDAANTAAATAASTAVATQPATTQGIIMRDGGVCDSIRHTGC
jgi:hypothetical protein